MICLPPGTAEEAPPRFLFSKRRLPFRLILLGWSLLCACGMLLICSKSSPLYPMNDWVDVQCFFTVGRGILQGKMPEAVVAFVDGFNSFYVDGPAFKMESAIINDLIPFIESTYHGMGTKAGRVIGGISMGGFGTARFCLKYPHMFSCAVMLSPAVWHEIEEGKCSCAGWGLFKEFLTKDRWPSVHPEAYLEGYAKAHSPVRFFIAHGTKDAAVPLADVTAFAERLQAFAPVDYVTAEGEEHAWPFWEMGMRTGLEYAGRVLLGQA